jgi:CHAT domain-containing protein/Tfp pilus assembly protein PilF
MFSQSGRLHSFFRLMFSVLQCLSGIPIRLAAMHSIRLFSAPAFPSWTFRRSNPRKAWGHEVLFAWYFVAIFALTSHFARAQSSLQDALEYNRIAIQRFNASQYKEAESLYRRALAIDEEILGPNHPDVARVLVNLALLYQKQARISEAEALQKRALGIREKVFGRNNAETAQSLVGLAELYLSEARYTDAEPLFKQALAAQQKVLNPEHSDLALSMNDLGELYQIQGRFSDAEPLLKRALNIREKAFGLNHRGVADSLANLAELYRAEGRYADAEPLFKRALAVYEKALGRDQPDVTISLGGLGNLYELEGRYTEAEPLLKRALAIQERTFGPNYPALSIPLNDLGAVYKMERRYAEAEVLFKRALAITERTFGSNHSNLAGSLNNLAVLYGDQGRFAEAEPLYKRALQLSEKTFGPTNPQTAIAMNNLARVYLHQGSYANALAIVEKTIATNSASSRVAFATLHGSELKQLIGRDAALADSYKVLQVTSSTESSEAIIRVAQRFAAGSGELAQLVRRDQDFEEEAKRLQKTLLTAVSKAPAQRNASYEQEVSQRIDTIAAEQARIHSDLNRKFPDYVALAKPLPLTVAETQSYLTDDEAVIAFSVEDNASYAWVITRSDASWTEIPIKNVGLVDKVKRLRPQFEQRSNYALPFDTTVAYQLYQSTMGPIADKLIGKTRLSMVLNGALSSIPFGLLVTQEPSGKSLKQVDWLIKSFAITVLPSIYSLKTLRSSTLPKEAPKPMIAFADPIFSMEATLKAETGRSSAMRSLPGLYSGAKLDLEALRRSLVPLPATRAEVMAIGQTLKVDKSDLRFGLDASEAVVKRTKLDQYRIVYFATHGLVAGDLAQFGKVGAEPALALTMPSHTTDFDDGLLQASEVAQLKLNATWAVLSACNTASSEVVGAEALTGLARGFLYAGARSLVVSHWAVDDITTVQLMSELFRLSQESPNLSHGEMLREAMLKLINSAQTEQDAHPAQWAAFVVVGEPAKFVSHR